MGAAQRRLAVRFDEAVWREAVRGFSRRPLEIATSARSEAERRGIALAAVIPCEPLGPDGTALAGCAKLYLPAGDDPPSERPFAFVLQLAREPDSTLVWVFVAFGHRHPRARVRSVYERAHRQLHGRFPEQSCRFCGSAGLNPGFNLSTRHRTERNSRVRIPRSCRV